MSYPYLIIGQGIAGSLLAHALLESGADVCVVDNNHASSSSKVAAGLINPIIGKRFTLDDQYPQFFDTAVLTYRNLEQKLNTQFFFKKPIMRFVQTDDELSYWNEQKHNPDLSEFIQTSFNQADYETLINTSGETFLIHGGGYCDTYHFIQTYRYLLISQNKLIEDNFHPEDMRVESDHIVWKEKKFKHIIFAQGHQDKHNPWFDWIRFDSAKGEVLTLKPQNAITTDTIFNFGKWVCPSKNGNFKCGSTYEWDDLSDSPTEKAKNEILSEVDKFWKIPYEINQHLTGIRPIIKDRKPILGTHPDYPQIAIFNGLGSKGVLWGPYYAQMLKNYLLDNAPIDQTVDVKRFA